MQCTTGIGIIGASALHGARRTTEELIMNDQKETWVTLFTFKMPMNGRDEGDSRIINKDQNDGDPAVYVVETNYGNVTEREEVTADQALWAAYFYKAASTVEEHKADDEETRFWETTSVELKETRERFFVNVEEMDTDHAYAVRCWYDGDDLICNYVVGSKQMATHMKSAIERALDNVNSFDDPLNPDPDDVMGRGPVEEQIHNLRTYVRGIGDWAQVVAPGKIHSRI